LLTTLKVAAGCKFVTENSTFKFPIVVDTESKFIPRTIQIPRIHLMSEDSAEEVEKHLNTLNKMKMREVIYWAEFENLELTKTLTTIIV
jgi:hypothetical protein